MPAPNDPQRPYYDKEMKMLEDKDIDGSIYIKAEWHGFGESMPPARAETLFQQSGEKASRRKPNVQQA